MYYLDTSFIAPAFIREAASTQVIDWLKKTLADSLYASLWVKTEFASLLAMNNPYQNKVDIALG